MPGITEEQRARRRQQVLHYLSLGNMTDVEIASRLSVHRDTIRRDRQWLREQGQLLIAEDLKHEIKDFEEKRMRGLMTLWTSLYLKWVKGSEKKPGLPYLDRNDIQLFKVVNDTFDRDKKPQGKDTGVVKEPSHYQNVDPSVRDAPVDI